MDRRRFVKSAAFVPLVAAAAPLMTGAAPANSDEGATTPPSGSGPLGERFALTFRRVLSGGPPAYTDDFLLADVRPEPVRRFTEYSGDLSGRYIGARAMVARVYGGLSAQDDLSTRVDALVGKVIALQKPDGYFGAAFHYEQPTDLDLALLWGNGRLLVGLLEYYAFTPKPEVLAACKRLGEWLIRIGPLMLSAEMRAKFGAKHFASSYICWMQQTEGLALLYAATKDERYRRLAEQVAAVIERRPGDHVHGYLTSLRGAMELYRATGDKRWLQQCEAAWSDIAESKDLLITGGVPEGWSPNNHRTEGCGEADWVRLNLALWNATHGAKYRAMAERAIFNEFAFNQFASGDFGHRLYTDTGLPAQGAVRAWWCCTLHGLRAFPDIHRSVFRGGGSEIFYDFPLDGRIESGNLTAVAESTLGSNGKCRINVTAASTEPVKLLIRKLEWSPAPEVHIKGKSGDVLESGDYRSIERRWSAGDVVEIVYPMNLRSEPAGADRMAFWCGPWLLGASATDNPGYFNELTGENKLIPSKARPLASGDEPRRYFTVPAASTQMPYIPAEFADQPGSVTLRPIAEQTGQPTTAWELRFKITNDQTKS